MFLPHNTPNTSDEQIIAMNDAWMTMLKMGYSAARATATIKAVRTAFFQPAQELIDLSETRTSYEGTPKRTLETAFKTVKGALEIRTTKKYRDGWSHLDEWAFLGRFELISAYHTHDYDGCDETSETTLAYMVESDIDAGAATEAIEAMETRSGCTHDYDCCGCWHYSADVTEIVTLGKYNIFHCVVKGSRNY